VRSQENVTPTAWFSFELPGSFSYGIQYDVRAEEIRAVLVRGRWYKSFEEADRDPRNAPGWIFANP
jgi:hypothetical protein